MTYVKDCQIVELKGVTLYNLHPIIKTFGHELHEM